MSITSSLSNALTGLTAASRAAELVSNNVANAMTEGYGRREINLSARAVGGAGAGVQVDGVTRIVDQAVIGDRRIADATLGGQDVVAGFLERLRSIVGEPDDTFSVTGRVAAFEAALVEAASRPDVTARLAAVAAAASALAVGIRSISDDIQGERMAADASIADQVARLNDGIRQVAELNKSIVRMNAVSEDTSALEDQRQRIIDGIASIVPIRELRRDNGAVALYTTNGAFLVDGPPTQIGFTPTPVITPDMTLASGALSGVVVGGRQVRTDGAYSPIAGGSLAAAFAVRDELAVTAQARIDSFARDLVERFQDPSVDPTLPPGAAGLFTDGGTVFDPANEGGLAARISVNALVDPGAAAEFWRLRSGIGSASPGAAGDNALLLAMSSAMSVALPPASAAIVSAARSSAGLAGELQSLIGREVLAAETERGFQAARRDSLLDAERRNGVDTDQEMQKLLLIEQTFAANARVVQTVDDMIRVLLEI